MAEVKISELPAGVTVDDADLLASVQSGTTRQVTRGNLRGMIETMPTAETDTALVLAPDGAGGVEFRAEAGGGGGGTETRRIPIRLLNPRVSTLSGNSFFTVKALTNIDLGMWEFVKDVQGKVYGIVNVPNEVDATPNAKIILIVAANATSGVTRLNVSSKSVAEDAESINVSLTADTAQDITVPGTAYLGKKVSFTVGDLANIAAKDVLVVEILHEGDHANDTLAVNTLLLDSYLEVDVTTV